jgi:hypothetical protein
VIPPSTRGYDAGADRPRACNGLAGRAGLIIQREFSPSSFGSVLRLSTAIGLVAYAMIPIFLGAVGDLAGGYRAVLAACIGLQVTAAFLMTLGAVKERITAKGAVDYGGDHQDRVVPPHL